MVTCTANPTVVDSALGDLVLKIRGSNRNGQLLRLKSDKCTIGSGPTCTLRLRGRGIGPLHCLILRGPNGTVIRRWSNDTLLNGRSFSNAQLTAGDRLHIGSLEFEVMATGEITSERSGITALTPDFRQHEESLEQQAKQLAETTAAMKAERDTFNSERSQWEELRNASLQEETRQQVERKEQLRREEESLEQQAQQLAEATVAMKAERAAFNSERSQWEELRNASLQEEARQRSTVEEETLARLKAHCNELESQQQALLLQQKQWQTELESERQLFASQQESQQAEQAAALREYQDLEGHTNERAKELDAFSTELDIRNKQLEALSTELDVHEKYLDSRSAELDLHDKDLTQKAFDLQSQIAEQNDHAKKHDARNNQLEARAAKLQAQEVELKHQADKLDGRSEDIDAKETELQSKITELANRSAQVDAQVVELETHTGKLKRQSDEIQAQFADLQAEKANFAANKSEFEIERSRWDELCRAKEANLAERENELTKKTAQLENMLVQVRLDQENIELRRAELQSERDQWETERSKDNMNIQPSMQFEPLPTESLSSELPPAVSAVLSQAGAATVDNDDFHHRLGRKGEVSVENNQATQAPFIPQSTVQVDGEEKTSSIPSQQVPAHDNEESVDQYMVRLMERIRGAQGPLANADNQAYNPDSCPSDTASFSTENETYSPTMPNAALPEFHEPVEISPRTVAPEKRANITLFRDLANYSAQTAIGTHARHQMTRIMYTKLTVALIGGFTGLLLIWVWQSWFTSNITLISAIMSFAVAIIWGIQYVLTTINLLINGTDEPDSAKTAQPEAEVKNRSLDTAFFSQHGDKENAETEQ